MMPDCYEKVSRFLFYYGSQESLSPCLLKRPGDMTDLSLISHSKSHFCDLKALVAMHLFTSVCPGGMKKWASLHINLLKVFLIF